MLGSPVRVGGPQSRLHLPAESRDGFGMGLQGPTGGMKIMKKMERTSLQSSQKGVTMIETLIAGGILAMISLDMAGLILVSIVLNNRNKIDSTYTMRP